MRFGIAVLAFIALAVLDYMLIGAAFLGRPKDGDPLTLVVVAGFALALVLRQRWLVFAAQNVVTVLGLVRGLQVGADLRLSDLAGFVLTVLLGNLLAWLIARAIPPARRAVSA